MIATEAQSSQRPIIVFVVLIGTTVNVGDSSVANCPCSRLKPLLQNKKPLWALCLCGKAFYLF